MFVTEYFDLSNATGGGPKEHVILYIIVLCSKYLFFLQAISMSSYSCILNILYIASL